MIRLPARRPRTSKTGRRQGRGDVSDAQWAMIEPLLPRQRRGGRWNDHRVTFDGMLWVMRTGAPWRDLPERYGKWQSVHHYFNRWRKDGTIDKVLKALRIRLDKNGHIDWDLWCVDGTSVRASRSAAGASKNRRAGPKRRGPRAGLLKRRVGIKAPPGR